ncbi:MAG: PIN domain-containing protein [Rhodobacteraceae bacterium]|nr:PIN domain-containing protein [Paracoccaceae bacterium]
MTAVLNRPVVVLDANVLFPFRTRDILLRFHHAGLFQARWTERILDEWTRNLLDWKPHLERSVRSQRRAMAEQFEDALVIGYEPLVRTLDLPDAGDRHVLAAAIRCGAAYIVTDNLTDFPKEALAGFDIEAIAADTFRLQIAELHPSEALAVLRALRVHYRNPPFGKCHS